MAISRLIYGRSGMQGLYLLPENWYDEHRVTCWLNTRAVRIDRNAQHVELATGDVLAYDRLIVTAGSSSFVPPIEGFGAPGSFVLREAEDAMQIRSYVQECTSRKAIVAGGGLLGLEAGYALHKLGVKVTVLERGAWLLRRQLDEPASQLLRYYLENLGIDIVLEGETAQINANGRVTGVTLADGSTLSCDLFLVSAGIRSNVQIGVEAGLAANQGIVVDDELRTADPQILAAGDAAEHRGRVSGLWPAAVEQGRIAGINAVGGQARYEGSVPVTMLKVTGVDVLSAGRFEPEPGDTVIVDEDQIEGRYRKLVLKDGKIAGAIMLGYPVEARGVTDAMGAGLDVAPFVPKLEAGDWSVFETAVSAVN
jgi:nitrite reductase (NADH) large subunit